MRLLLVGSIFSLLISPSIAQEWPSLVGTWKGTSRAVVSNNDGHYGSADVSSTHAFVSADLTIEWTDESDGRYVGTITSNDHTEPKMAILSSDGKSLFTVDLDGSSVGRLIDNDHIELCYTHTPGKLASMVLSCVNFERQK